jgi:hypothetical protein
MKKPFYLLIVLAAFTAILSSCGAEDAPVPAQKFVKSAPSGVIPGTDHD